MKRTAILGLLLLVTLGSLFLTSCVSTKMEENKVAERWHYGRPLYEVYVRAFSYDGTLDRVTEKLDELKELGIKTLWLMPVHPHGELGRKGSMGSPYSTYDYFAIGEEYGTKEDFRELIEAAHARDMKVILDIALNHSANDHIEMENHPEWYAQDSTGAFIREVADWSDITDWDFNNPETHEYLTSILTYWVREFDLDGYRCDVAGMVPGEFWFNAIQKVREIKPDVFMLAEWEDEWVLEKGFDAGYDWTLFHRMRDHRKGTIELDSLWSVIDARDTRYPDHALPMRFVENHDEHRSADEFGWPGVKPYAALIFTIRGIPLLYNGQEIGATHKPTLFESEPIHWEQEQRGVNPYYKELLGYRNSYEALRAGDITRIESGNDSVLMFTRSFGKETILVAINFSNEAVEVAIPEEILKKRWNLINNQNRFLKERETLDLLDYNMWIKQ